MSAPNPELVEILMGASEVPTIEKLVEQHIRDAGKTVSRDLIVNQGRQYKKSTVTIAALLSQSLNFRDWARRKLGWDVYGFDAEMARIRDAWQQETNQPSAGRDIARALFNNTTPF